MMLKHILINDYIYIELLIEELCKYNISYLFIKSNNELHFDKYIIRFYIIDDIKKNKFIIEHLLFTQNIIESLSNYNEFVCDFEYIYEPIDFHSISKKTLNKLYNNLYTNKIKNNNISHGKILERQFNSHKKRFNIK